MTISKEEMEVILKDTLNETDHSKSSLSISPYGSQGKKYLYLYQIKKNIGGM